MLKITNVDEPKTKKRIPKPHNGNDSSKYKVYTYDFGAGDLSGMLNYQIVILIMLLMIYMYKYYNDCIFCTLLFIFQTVA